jgi:hypothetical protein
MSNHSEQPTTTRLMEWVFSCALGVCVALIWVGLFKLNAFFFDSIGFSHHISWIFLPAAIRMISVMLLDWIGAAGLFAGALITNAPWLDQNLSESIALAGLSSLGPVLAVTFCTRWLRMKGNLSGLGLRQLTLFGVVGALCNVVPHNIYFYMADRMQSPLDGVIPMFVGDLIGTVIVLYVCALFLKYIFPQQEKFNQTIR